MKKRILSLLLSLLLLCSLGSAFAAGGDSSDPLISLSYLRDFFFGETKTALENTADKIVADYRSSHQNVTPATKVLTLSPGDALELTEGQYFVLLSGSANLYADSGLAVNATQGWETSGGAVRSGNRYLACENSRLYLDVSQTATVSVSYGAAQTKGCPFADVSRGQWYYSDVTNAYDRGLVNGMTLTSYAPSGTLTCAQAVKLAACMHQLYHTGSVTLQNSEGNWYQSYVDYAVENGILEQSFNNYDSAISRRGFVKLFYHALPASSYAAINAIADGAIPDVAADAECAAEIYAFYRAGILTGYSNTSGYAEHAFGPGGTISRAEVATIMNRMFDASARQSFSID